MDYYLNSLGLLGCWGLNLPIWNISDDEDPVTLGEPIFGGELEDEGKFLHFLGVITYVCWWFFANPLWKIWTSKWESNLPQVVGWLVGWLVEVSKSRRAALPAPFFPTPVIRCDPSISTCRSTVPTSWDGKSPSCGLNFQEEFAPSTVGFLYVMRTPRERGCQRRAKHRDAHKHQPKISQVAEITKNSSHIVFF